MYENFLNWAWSQVKNIRINVDRGLNEAFAPTREQQQQQTKSQKQQQQKKHH